MLLRVGLATSVCLALLALGCGQVSSASPAARIGKGNWTIFENTNYVNGLLVAGEDLWAATSGGVVNWDLKTGQYQEVSTLDGLVDDRVLAVASDSHGSLWFGTQYGVNRLSGTNWTTFTVTNGLAYDWVRSIYCTGNGDVWIGGAANGSIYDGSGFRQFQTGKSNGGAVTAIFEDSRGMVWVGMQEGGVSRYDGRSWTNFTNGTGLTSAEVYSVGEDANGRVWVGTYSGINVYDGSTWRSFTVRDGLTDDDVTAILKGRDGTMWFGTARRGVMSYDGTNWSTYSTGGAPAGDVSSIAEDGQGRLYFGTSSGIVSYDGKSWHTLKTSNIDMIQNIHSMAQDPKGNLWFRDDFGRVVIYDGRTWRTFEQPWLEQIAFGHLIYADREGNIWLGNGRLGIKRFDGTNWETFVTLPPNISYPPGPPIVVNQRSGLLGTVVLCMFEDKRGGFWFSTESGLSYYAGTSWQTFAKKELPTIFDVSGMGQDNKGVMWFATRGGGLMRYDGSAWSLIAHGTTFASNTFGNLVIDHQGNVWVGGTRYDGSEWTDYPVPEGGSITAQDNRGDLWFASYLKGASRLDSKGWTTFTTRNGLASNSVNVIFADRSGRVWFGTRNGLSVFSNANNIKQPDARVTTAETQ